MVPYPVSHRDYARHAHFDRPLFAHSRQSVQDRCPVLTQLHLGKGLHRRTEPCQEPSNLFCHAEVVLSDPLMRLTGSLMLLLKLLMGSL